MCCRRRILNCFLQLLHQAHSAPGFGVTNSDASGTLCVGLDDLAGREGPLSLGFVNVLLQPIFAGLVFVVGTGCGASAFVGSPAPAARGRSRGILAIAPMANHNWPSSLSPHGFASNVSLRATFRWAEKLCMRWLLHVHWLSLPLASCLHSILVLVKHVFPREDQGIQCLSVEFVHHGPVDLFRNARRNGPPSVPRPSWAMNPNAGCFFAMAL